MRLRKVNLQITLKEIWASWKLYVVIIFTWIAILAELFIFFYFNITIPLIGWAILIYTWRLVLTALTQSTLFNARSCVYGKITTIDSEIEGFIVAKGEDNYIIQTKEKGVLLSNNYVKFISQAALPDAKEVKKSI